MSKEIQKKLAAIMFTHLVEYEEYSKNDKKFAKKVLKEHYKIINEIVPLFNGNIIKHLDDKTFIEYLSATDAVNAALSLHLKFKKENAT